MLQCCVCLDDLPPTNTRRNGYVYFGCGRHAVCRACFAQVCVHSSGDVQCPLCRTPCEAKDVVDKLELLGVLSRCPVEHDILPRPVLRSDGTWVNKAAERGASVLTCVDAGTDVPSTSPPVAFVHPGAVAACNMGMALAGYDDDGVVEVAHVRELCCGLASVAPDLQYLSEERGYYLCTLSFHSRAIDGKLRVGMCWTHKASMMALLRALSRRYSQVIVTVADIGQDANHTWVMPSDMVDEESLLPARWLRDAASAGPVSSEALQWVRSRAVMSLTS